MFGQAVARVGPIEREQRDRPTILAQQRGLAQTALRLNVFAANLFHCLLRQIERLLP